MGGCATKPKVLIPETAAKTEAPSDLPAEEIEESRGDQNDQSNVQVEADTVKEIVEADMAAGEELEQDQQGNFKRRSLSHLFKENEEGNDSTESEKTLSQTVTQKAEPLENRKAKEELENNVTTREGVNSETNKHKQILATETEIEANLIEEKSPQVEVEIAKVITSGEKYEKEVPEGEMATGEENAKAKTFEEQNEKEILDLKKAENELEEETAKVIISGEKTEKDTPLVDAKENSI